MTQALPSLPPSLPSLPNTGDVWPSSGLKASVAARSFNRELIVIGESRTNPFMQVRGCGEEGGGGPTPSCRQEGVGRRGGPDQPLHAGEGVWGGGGGRTNPFMQVRGCGGQIFTTNVHTIVHVIS